MTHQNELGFTLIESLFVLSVFFLIASLSLFLFRPHHSYLEKELFFSQLKTDIFHAQHHALSTQRPIVFNIDPSRHYYYAKDFEGKLLLERYYSKDIKVSEGSLKLSWEFNANGNLSKFGSIYIYFGSERYRLTFLIGRGRFYVVKE